MPKEENGQTDYGNSVLRSNRTRARIDRFHQWERRGRGWDIFPHAVLEPEFEPFIVPSSQPAVVVDDARKPSTLQSLFGGLRKRLSSSNTPLPNAPVIETARQSQQRISTSTNDISITELQLFLPQTLKVSTDAAMQLLLSFSAFRSSPIGFELIGTANKIIAQFACRMTDVAHVLEQTQSHFPDGYVCETRNALQTILQPDSKAHRVIVEFGLAQPFMLPLRTATSFDPDPLIAVVAALSELKTEECGLVQILFQKTRNNWATEIMRSLTDDYSKPFFTNRPDLLPLAKQKVAQQLLAVVIRIAAQSTSIESARRIAKHIGSALEQFTNPAGNQLVPLSNRGYEQSLHECDILQRTSHRSGMLLSATELVSLVHPPSASVKSTKFVRQYKKTKATPQIAQGNGFVLGQNTHRGQTLDVSLNKTQRTKHLYILGSSGSGKSTLLCNLAKQDVEAGEGICVIDPHGDLIEKILTHIPEARHDDVVLIDPADESFPVGLNILSAHSERERVLLSSDLVAAFKRTSTSWGDQMNSVFGNAILAFLESDTGGTLVDLRRFLLDAKFRNEFLETVRDEETVFYWKKEFPLLKGTAATPILTRLDTFLRPKIIRNMVAQRENKIDFRAIMDKRKILLVKLSQGLIGQSNAYLLGTLIIAKLYQAALSRQEIEESKRKFFAVTIDEFQNMITPTMSEILSGARKYGISLSLAHQDYRQLWNQDTELASSVLTNPYTRICFRLGDFDAQKLADGFSSFEPSDFQNLGVGEAIVRVERNEYDFNLATFPLPQVDENLARQRREKIVELSRNKYARRREDVEQDLTQQRQETGKDAIVESPITRKSERTKQLQQENPRYDKEKKQHFYLQTQIKKIAERRGYLSTIEKDVLGGTGKIDVALERDDLKIACEISVTTPSEYELQNIQKCLAAGYKPVVVISASEKHLSNIKQRAQNELSADDLTNVVFLQPDSFYAFLESLSKTSEITPDGVDRVKGFKVNVAYGKVNETETKLRSQALAEIISNAKRRRKP